MEFKPEVKPTISQLKKEEYFKRHVVNNDVSFHFEPMQEAVTFTPTDDEFKDPLTYIEQIRPIAEHFGICKIIPPKSWKPKFCIDMNTFKFTPRVQRLNELEANTRIKLNFLDKLSKFWELQGNKFRIPIIERNPLDLYKLYKIVEAMGGYENVVKNKLWMQITRQMNYKDLNAPRQLKQNYEKFLYPYLLFEAGITVTNKKNDNNDDEDDENLMLVDEDEAEQENTKVSSNKSQKKSNKTNKKKPVNTKSGKLDIEKIDCLVCERGDDEAYMLLCDECDDSYHTFCLIPPLKEIPKGDWRCPTCVSQICKKPTDTYGFEQSRHKYSLNEFGQMGNKFKTDYFKKPHNEVTSDEIEREFWRILSSPNESVAVEYGADLHTLDTGSGFPTRSYKGKLSTNDLEYLNSPWNLNNLSLLEKSVLSQMNVNISGMKVPWAYVGMCFSCFCWHVEDHWSYSINYLHFGDIKTWYGVPGSGAAKFEEVMKSNAKELFEKSPDLLHHLVTIMNPNLLRKNNVPIYKINQRVGEFVVTFPRAYHAGFNQGFNFAEAVNFCPADWMSLGRAAIESYKQVKRHTVFSHDELVCKIATNKDLIDINTAFAIQKELEIIFESETRDRNLLHEKGIKQIRKSILEMLPDDDRTCDYCKTTCFISALKCSCRPDKLVCLNHYEHLCSATKFAAKSSITQNSSHRLTLIYRYTINELHDLLVKFKGRIVEYFKWMCKVEKILYSKRMKSNEDSDIIEINEYDSESTDSDDPMDESDEKKNNSTNKPNIKKLYKLIEEAKAKKYPRFNSSLSKSKMFAFNDKNKLKTNGYLYFELEKEYNKALACSKLCKDFINLYKNRSDKNLLNTDEEQNNNDDNENDRLLEDLNDIEDDDDKKVTKKSKNSIKIRQKYQLDQLKSLVSEIEDLSCEIDEKSVFISLFEEAIQYEIRIKEMIKNWNLDSPIQLKRVLNYLDSIDIEFPFMLVEQLKLMYKQAVWLDKVNTAIQNPNDLTISIIRSFVDKVLNDNLLINLSDNPKSKKIIQKTLNELQELLSIAETWNQKAKAQIESKTKLELSMLEKTLNEAKHIPAYLENVKKLETIVDNSNQLIINIERLLKDSKYPYLSDLTILMNQASELPVKIDQAKRISTRVSLANEWIKSLNVLFKRSASHQDSTSSSPTSYSNIGLLEILTPRTDLNAIVHKLQNQLSSAQPTSVSPKSSTNPSANSTANTTTKRSRAKSLNISAQLNNLSQQIEQQPVIVSVKSTSIDNVFDFYNTNKNRLNLTEEYKAHQFRELELLKSLRNLNKEKLTLFINNLSNENNSANEISDKKNETTPTISKSNSKNNANTTGSSLIMKCCSCYKSIMSSIHANNVQQCKICLGLFHNACKTIAAALSSNDSGCCSSCERSKRPQVKSVMDKLMSLEKLEVCSFEGNALQMFSSRLLNWQERCNSLFKEMNIFSLLKKNENLDTELLNAYEALSSLKKADLTNVYLEGLLLEISCEEKDTLNHIFQLVNNYEMNLDKLKSKLSSSAANVSIDESNANETNDNQSTKSANNSNKKTKSNKTEIDIKSNKNSKNMKKLNISNSKIKLDVTSSPQSKSNDSTPKQSRKRDAYEIEDEEFCAADKCSGPTGDNIKWVQCDGTCNRWFHMICAGISKIRKKEKFLCTKCGGNVSSQEARPLSQADFPIEQEDEDQLNERSQDEEKREISISNKKFKETTQSDSLVENEQDPPMEVNTENVNSDSL